jgi:hypothetical protein
MDPEENSTSRNEQVMQEQEIKIHLPEDDDEWLSVQEATEISLKSWLRKLENQHYNDLSAWRLKNIHWRVFRHHDSPFPRPKWLQTCSKISVCLPPKSL